MSDSIDGSMIEIDARPVIIPYYTARMTPKKPWYKSKTLWVNLVALLALGLQNMNGFALSAAEQGSILAVINIFLRLITYQELE